MAAPAFGNTVTYSLSPMATIIVIMMMTIMWMMMMMMDTNTNQKDSDSALDSQVTCAPMSVNILSAPTTTNDQRATRNKQSATPSHNTHVQRTMTNKVQQASTKVQHTAFVRNLTQTQRIFATLSNSLEPQFPQFA